MDVDVRELGGSRYTVHISLDKAEVNDAFGKTFQELSKRGGIRGFRPGKVPRQIIERNYEADLIRAITYDDLLQSRLEKAMEEADLRPIDQLDVKHGTPPDEDEVLAETIKAGLAAEEEGEEAEADDAAEVTEAAEAAEAVDESATSPEESLEEAMEDVPLQEGEPFEFYATFTAYPKPQLPDLSELKLKRPVAEIAEAAIDEQIEELRRVNAEDVETDRETIADGDAVVVEIGILLEDEERDDLKMREEEIIVGSRDYIGDIDQALIGHAPGDTVEVEYTFSEDHPNEDLAGKSAQVIAEVSSFSARKLPDLTDEFAQTLGDYETLDDLRASIREQLEAAARTAADEELGGQVLRQLIDGTVVDIPEQMVDEAAGRSFEELQSELQQTGMSVEEFAEANDIDVEELRENQRVRAEGTLKLHFAVEALARDRGIAPAENDVMAELLKVAEQTGSDLGFVMQAASVQPQFMEDMRERATQRLLLEQLIASAEVEDVTQEDYEAWLESRESAATEVSEVSAAEASNESVETPAEEDAEESDSE